MDAQKNVLDFSIVQANLAGKEYIEVNPKDIKDSLLGNGDKARALGIVPLHDISRYRDFVDLFKNILHLANLGQQEIKETLLSVYRRDLLGGDSHINLAEKYENQVSHLHVEKEKLAALEKVEPLINGLTEARQKRDVARRDIPALYVALSGAKERLTALNNDAIGRHHLNLAKFKATLDTLSESLRTADDTRLTLAQSKGGIEQELRSLARDADEFADYLPELEAQTILNLVESIATLSGRIHNVQSIPILEREINTISTEIKRLNLQRTHHAELLGTQLVGHGHNIQDTFRLLNPAILGLRSGAELQIDDEKGMLQSLSSLNDHITDGVYRGSGVVLTLDALTTTDSISAISLDELDMRIQERQVTLADKQKALADAQQVESIRVERDALQTQRDVAVLRSGRYKEFQLKQASVVELTRQKNALVKQLEQNTLELSNLSKTQTDLSNQIREANEALRDSEQEIKKVSALSFAMPNSQWEVGSPDPMWPDELYALHRLYEKTMNDYETMDSESEKLLRQIGLLAPDVVRGVSQDERMDSCEAALNALSDYRVAYAEQLSTMVIGMRATFDGMLRALDAIKGRGVEINRKLALLTVSNLRNLRVEIEEIHDQTMFFRNIVNASSNDLLADVGSTEAAVKNIYARIAKAPVLRLSDWFGVRFIVENGNGETKRYENLTKIESNGTTMTIKLLVNIILIKSLLRAKRTYLIPFWIDEASQIDPENLREIIDLANENGFCPVLASTNAMSVAEFIYSIQLNKNGRSVVVNGGILRRTDKRAEKEAHVAATS